MPIQWNKKCVALERYESAGAFDVNGDGKPEIVSGAYWYENCDIRGRHIIGDVAAYGEYYDDFSTIPMDINGNGRLDFITGGWWGDTLRWRENPGDPKTPWPEHIIAHTGNVETTRAWDVDGDGELEVVPNTPGGPLVVYKLITWNGKGTGRFTAHKIWSMPQGHGLGFGDVNGDGRGDFIFCNGWLQAPADPYQGSWTFHQEFDLGTASVPILVVDLNGDGVNELIVGQAHGYGLDWYQQHVQTDGTRRWTKHPIDPFNAQLITGKRWRAHLGHDAGSFDDYGIFYFKWNGESFSKQVIDYGKPGVGKGCGIHFALADLSGHGRLDLVAPGKDGLYFYENLGS